MSGAIVDDEGEPFGEYVTPDIALCKPAGISILTGSDLAPQQATRRRYRLISERTMATSRWLDG